MAMRIFLYKINPLTIWWEINLLTKNCLSLLYATPSQDFKTWLQVYLSFFYCTHQAFLQQAWLSFIFFFFLSLLRLYAKNTKPSSQNGVVCLLYFFLLCCDCVPNKHRTRGSSKRERLWQNNMASSSFLVDLHLLLLYYFFMLILFFMTKHPFHFWCSLLREKKKGFLKQRWRGLARESKR